MNMHDEHGHPMRKHAVVSAFAIAFALLAVGGVFARARSHTHRGAFVRAYACKRRDSRRSG
jgi:hypothetical protein